MSFLISEEFSRTSEVNSCTSLLRLDQKKLKILQLLHLGFLATLAHLDLSGMGFIHYFTLFELQVPHPYERNCESHLNL